MKIKITDDIKMEFQSEFQYAQITDDVSFNPKRDIRRVEPSKVLKISQILSSGVVPPEAQDTEYNGIEDPSMVGSRVTDVFQATDAMASLANIPAPSQQAAGE